MLRGKLCAIEEDSRGGWVGHRSSDGVRGDGGSGQGQGRGGYDRREQKCVGRQIILFAHVKGNAETRSCANGKYLPLDLKCLETWLNGKSGLNLDRQWCLIQTKVEIMQVCIMQPSPPPLLGGIMHVLFSLYCAIGSRGSSRGDRRSSQRDIWWQTRGRSCTPPWQSRALTTSDDIWQYLMTDHCGHLTIGNRLYRDSDFLPSKFHYGGLPNHPTFVFVI